MNRVYILDTGAFIGGFDLQNGKSYTLQEVLEELRDERARLRAELGVRRGKLIIASSPDTEEVEKAAEDTGDITHLSGTDLKVISLGLDFKKRGYEPVIVTDDYSMQNVAQKLSLEFVPVAEKGIKKSIVWRRVCRGCGRVYPASFRDNCTFCGSMVKRRIYRDSRK